MDNEIAQRVFQQVMDLWITPEIEKRKIHKKIPSEFKLRSAQIVFSSERTLIKIRLNNEVKAIAKCKVNKAKNKGDFVYEEDIENIESIELTDKDPNSAHLTLLLIKGRWIISFDFRYNKKRILEHIEASKEFLESAKDNLNKNRLRPFFEDSFACAELLAKSILLQLPDKEMLYGKDHIHRIDKFKNWASLGNVSQKHSDILKRLKELRSSARYLSSNEFEKEDPKKVLVILEEMFLFAKKSME